MSGDLGLLDQHVVGRRLRFLGWVATTAMALTVVAMLVTL